MDKKSEDLLLPSAQHHGSRLGLSTTLSTVMVDTREGEYLLEEAGKRALRIGIEEDLAAYAMTQTGELKARASRVFSRECALLDHIAADVQDTASSKYVTQFHHLLKDRLADQLLGIDEQAVRVIQYEGTAPLPAEKPKERRSPVARLLLGGE